MPTLAAGSDVSTEEILADERAVDMDPTMRLLDPDSTQFDTFTRRLPSRPATREKVNWMEEEYVRPCAHRLRLHLRCRDDQRRGR